MLWIKLVAIRILRWKSEKKTSPLRLNNLKSHLINLGTIVCGRCKLMQNRKGKII
jgi:hypothetical protein